MISRSPVDHVRFKKSGKGNLGKGGHELQDGASIEWNISPTCYTEEKNERAFKIKIPLINMESLEINFLRKITTGLRVITYHFIMNQERKYFITWNIVGYSAQYKIIMK